MRLVVQHSIPKANLDQSSSFLILSRTSAVLARRWGERLFSLSPLNNAESGEEKGLLQVDPFSGQNLRDCT